MSLSEDHISYPTVANNIILKKNSLLAILFIHWALLYFIIKWSVLLILFFYLFANDPGDQGQSQVELYQGLKKMVLDVALLNAQHYKVQIKGKVEQSREWSSALPYTSV